MGRETDVDGWMDGQTGKQIERCKRDLDREEENDGRPTLL
jgi:hypothetical protein